MAPNKFASNPKKTPINISPDLAESLISIETIRDAKYKLMTIGPGNSVNILFIILMKKQLISNHQFNINIEFQGFDTSNNQSLNRLLNMLKIINNCNMRIKFIFLFLFIILLINCKREDNSLRYEITGELHEPPKGAHEKLHIKSLNLIDSVLGQDIYRKKLFLELLMKGQISYLNTYELDSVKNKRIKIRYDLNLNLLSWDTIYYVE